MCAGRGGKIHEEVEVEGGGALANASLCPTPHEATEFVNTLKPRVVRLQQICILVALSPFTYITS